MKITEVPELQSLKDEWPNLLRSSKIDDHVFLTWEWLSLWWKHFGKGRKLLTLAIEDERRILAIAPLMLSKHKVPSLGTINKVEFIGAPHSDYHNFIILDKEEECLELILKYLKDNISEWDWIELKEIPESTRTARVLRMLAPRLSPDLKVKERFCSICPFISLPASFELLMQAMSRSMRENFRRYLRKMRARYDVELHRYDEAGFSVADAMKTFITLHQEKWQSVNSPGLFGENESFRNFHVDLARSLADRGWLGLFFLMASGEPVAAQYAFEYKQKMYAYLSGFDPEYSKYSIGNLTIMLILQECIKKGVMEYDMMRGQESYKAWWTNESRRSLEVRLVRRDLLSRFYDWLTWSRTVDEFQSSTFRNRPLRARQHGA